MNITNIRTVLLGLVASFGFLAPVSAQILAGRAIGITISGVPAEEKAKVDGTYPVSESGNISIHLLEQPVRAAGLRPEDLAASIQSRYRSAGIYTHPTVQVMAPGIQDVEEIVHVGGQVRKPGPVKFTRGLTLWQAVQAGGGATEFGSMRRVRLFRGGAQKQYNLDQAQFKGILVEPKDTIEVPHKTIGGG